MQISTLYLKQTELKINGVVRFDSCNLELYLLASSLSLVSPYMSLEKGLGSTSHLVHTLSLVPMELTLTADTGRISLSSLQYCTAQAQ